MKLSYLYTTLIIIFSLVTFFSINHGPARQKQHKNLLDQNSIRLMALKIWTMDSDGSNKKQITNNGAANFGPYFFQVVIR